MGEPLTEGELALFDKFCQILDYGFDVSRTKKLEDALEVERDRNAYLEEENKLLRERLFRMRYP